MPTPAPTSTPIIPVTMHTRTIEESSQNMYYTIQASYPWLDWENDSRVEPINQAVEAFIHQEIEGFNKAAAERYDPTFEEDGGFMQINYRLVTNNCGILAFEFIIDTYFAPSAHPFRRTHTLNYDMVNGKVLTLDELFLPDSAYLETLSREVIADLSAREIITSEAGAQPVPENYHAWTITDEGLRITFDEYEVAPYSEGAQVVTIPYSRLGALIPPDGRLEGFLK